MKENIVLIDVDLKLYGKREPRNLIERIRFFFGINSYIWMTLKDIEYNIDGVKVIVPKGFKMDLASIPMFLQGIFSSHPPSLKAYILHDYIYVHNIMREEMGDKENRLWADKLMLSMANELWDNKIDNYIRYYGVRLFGKNIHNKY
jgi:hypothetical protein